MFCANCGGQVPDESAFCPSCGRVVQAPPAPPVPPPAPAAPFPPSSSAPAGPRYPRAPLGARLGAWFVDGIIASPLVGAGVLLLFSELALEEAPVIGLPLFLIGGLWFLVYTLGRDALTGAGFGKQLAGIVVVSYETGKPATGGPTVVRQLVLLATNLLPGVGSLIEPVLTLIDSEGRRLGDKLAKTQVASISQVESRGYTVGRKKSLAITLLVVTLIVSLVGSTISFIEFRRNVEEMWRSMLPPGNPWPSLEEVGTDFDSGTDSEADPSEDPEPVAELTQEAAIGTVGNFLNARKNGEPGTAANYATTNFQDQYDWFFDGTGPIQFEVVEAFEDAALYVVVVREEWQSGPENLYYFVTVENGVVLISDVAWEDQL